MLDVGCGAGFLANDLVQRGHRVTGIDSSRTALDVAARFDRTKNACYLVAEASALPFRDASFDAVCAMDLLEHVSDPARVVREAARVLVPGGKFFFHTFNRTVLAWLVVIKGVERFVQNTPRDLHVYGMFITPAELKDACVRAGLEVTELVGSRPRLGAPLLRMLLTKIVPDDLELVFTRDLSMGYTGVAIKRG